MKSRWNRPEHPVSPVLPFALPESRGLLLRIHNEPYEVVSVDRELQRNLSPPAGTFDKPSAPPPLPPTEA